MSEENRLQDLGPILSARQDELGFYFGRLASGNQSEMQVIGRPYDSSIGEIFIIPSYVRNRIRQNNEVERVFFFRAISISPSITYVKDLSGIATDLLSRSDAYFVDADQYLILDIQGSFIGYSEYNYETGRWEFNRPRRIPNHLARVYVPQPEVSDDLIRELLGSQIAGQLFYGNLVSGESVLNVELELPVRNLATHVGIFGTTGAGKSNLMQVLISSMILSNYRAYTSSTQNIPRIGSLIIDPHDEYGLGSGNDVDRRGIAHIVQVMSSDVRQHVIGDFFYLTPSLERTPSELRNYSRLLKISWNEIIPKDIISILELNPLQISYMNKAYSPHNENWISEILNSDEPIEGETKQTHSAVKRRLYFLKNSRIFNAIPPNNSVLAEIIEALEGGKIIDINTSLLSIHEQFLITTIVARTLFNIRQALASSDTFQSFTENARAGLSPAFWERFKNIASRLYRAENNMVRDISELPIILITIEEAPQILNSEILGQSSLFKDISRQGRKFGIGLVVISQQVSTIDSDILSQINTQFFLRLGNEREARAAIETASAPLSGFTEEYNTLEVGTGILTASYRSTQLPFRVPRFPERFEVIQQELNNSRAQDNDDFDVDF